MPIQRKLSRRSALTVLAGTGAGSTLLGGLGAAHLDLEKLSPAWFRERIRDRFVFQPTDPSNGARIVAELVDVTEAPRTGRRAQPFSLLFREVEGCSQGNACFAMAHADAVLPGVFIGRVLDREQGAHHEVIFN